MKIKLLKTERIIMSCKHEITELPEMLLWLHLDGIIAQALY